MPWHINDRELEKKLIEIDPDFVKTLTEWVEEKITNNWFNKDSITEVELTYNGVFLGMVKFFTHELEEVPEYNPHAWNDYPKVIPPYDKHMCLEFFETINQRMCRFVAYYTSNGWRSSVENGLAKYVLTDDLIESGYVKNVRFRPWED